MQSLENPLLETINESRRRRREEAATLRRIQRHVASREFAVAETLCDAIGQDSPDYANVLNIRGIIAADRQLLRDSVQLFQAAISSSPGNPHLHVNLGNTYAALGEPIDAIASLFSSLRIQPDLPGAYRLLVRQFDSIGLHDVAQEADRLLLLCASADGHDAAAGKSTSEDPISFRPRDHLAQFCLSAGLALHGKKHTAAACSCWECGYVWAPNSPVLAVHLSGALTSLGRGRGITAHSDSRR